MAYDAPAAAELLLGFLVDAVYELEVAVEHPLGGAADVHAAVELEGCSHGDHDSAAEVWFEARHELLLLGCSEGDPDDFGSVVVDVSCNGRLVELLDGEEG